MKVLFICYANISRSPLAEVILKKMLQEKGITDIDVESAGIHDFDGYPRDEAMGFYAREAGYEFGGTARFATRAILDSSDLIICMEHSHVENLRRHLPPDRWECIHTFNEICFNEQTNLIDPYGKSDQIYRQVFHKIETGCGILIQELSKKKVTTLYLVRHGETVDNVANILQGQQQGELTLAGIKQIEELAVSLSDIHFDTIVSSDLRRAYDSAQILAHHLKMEVQTTPLLRERDWGDFTGRFIPGLKGLPMPDNVEDMKTLLNRANSFLEWIKTDYSGKTVLAVGHGIINKAIQSVHYGKLTRKIPKMDNAEYRILQL